MYLQYTLCPRNIASNRAVTLSFQERKTWGSNFGAGQIRQCCQRLCFDISSKEAVLPVSAMTQRLALRLDIHSLAQCSKYVKKFDLMLKKLCTGLEVASLFLQPDKSDNKIIYQFALAGNSSAASCYA